MPVPTLPSGRKLGLKRPRHDMFKGLPLLGYVDPKSVLKGAGLPAVPKDFGHYNLIPKDGWGMNANDQWGDCAWAGAAHEHMLLNKIAGRTVTFTDTNVLSDYAACTGFAYTEATDNGTDMIQAANYRVNTGIVDAAGARHKIKAFVNLDITDELQLWAATYLFGVLAIGIDVPSTAEPQFDAGQEWVYVHGATIEGGHYVPLLGRAGGVNKVVTWGRLQDASPKFLSKYLLQAIAYVTDEALVNNRSPDGFDADALMADLATMKAA